MLGATIYRALLFINAVAHIVIVRVIIIVVILTVDGPLDSSNTRIKSDLTLQTSLNYLCESSLRVGCRNVEQTLQLTELKSAEQSTLNSL